MSSISPLVSRLTRAVFSVLSCVLSSGRFPESAHLDKKHSKARPVIAQSVCIEVAIAITLTVYIGWVCLRGWYFGQPIITSDNMLMGSVLVLFAVLAARLVWMVLLLLQNR